MGHEHRMVDPMVEVRALDALVAHQRSRPQIVDNDFPEWSHINDRLTYAFINAVKTNSPERFKIEVR